MATANGGNTSNARTFDDVRAALEIAARDGDIDAMVSLNREMVAIKRTRDDARNESERGARETLVAAVTTALASIKLPNGVTLTGTIRRTETGWDDVTLAAVLATAPELVHGALDGVLTDDAPSTARVITFDASGAKLGGPARAPRTSGDGTTSTRGRGWTFDGTSMSLGDVFERAATDAERADYAAQKDGNGKYQVRVGVAKRAGATQNE